MTPRRRVQAWSAQAFFTPAFVTVAVGGAAAGRRAAAGGAIAPLTRSVTGTGAGSGGAGADCSDRVGGAGVVRWSGHVEPQVEG